MVEACGKFNSDQLGFTVIEFRLNDKVKAKAEPSLTGKVIEDASVKSMGLENYAAQPVVFKGVKKVRLAGSFGKGAAKERLRSE